MMDEVYDNYADWLAPLSCQNKINYNYLLYAVYKHILHNMIRNSQSASYISVVMKY